jgi:hypothetical protein
MLRFLVSLALLACVLPGNSTAGSSALPKDYKECIDLGGFEMNVRGQQACMFSIWQHEASELFEACKRAGGGLLVADGEDGSALYSCRMRFLASGGTCHSNFCD